MRPGVNTAARRRIVKFLQKLETETLVWLERIGPDYIWILRNLYSPVPCTVSKLSETLSMSTVAVHSRRDQALFLLGFKNSIYPKRQRAAENRLREFEIRQRLTYVRDNITIGPGDRSILELALEYGANHNEVARHSKWTEQEALRSLSRLSGEKELKVIQPGERVRQAAFRDLRKTGVNPKAKLELEIFTELARDIGMFELGQEWQISPTVISSLTAEIRRELALHPSTRKAYAKLDRMGEENGYNGPYRVKWINSELLPLYRKFRMTQTPFSARERRYLQLRTKGRGIAYAAKEAFGIKHAPGTVIDRAFLAQIRAKPIVFPEDPPLPPFTREQQELMEELSYVRL